MRLERNDLVPPLQEVAKSAAEFMGGMNIWQDFYFLTPGFYTSDYVHQFCELSYQVPFGEIMLKDLFRYGLNAPMKSWLPEGKLN